MLYITGGKILTMAGRVYENGTIGIQNGKIAEIKEAHFTPPLEYALTLPLSCLRLLLDLSSPFFCNTIL